MISQEAINYLKKNGYSYEEIEWIKLWLEQYEKGKTISKDEMENFIKNELFSKYSTNV